jgi:hypothetical protein
MPQFLFFTVLRRFLQPPVCPIFAGGPAVFPPDFQRPYDRTEARCVGKIDGIGSKRFQSQFDTGRLVNNQRSRAGIHHGLHRSLPDFRFFDKTLSRITHIICVIFSYHYFQSVK